MKKKSAISPSLTQWRSDSVIPKSADADGELGLPEALVGVGQRGVGQDERQDRAQQQEPDTGDAGAGRSCPAASRASGERRSCAVPVMLATTGSVLGELLGAGPPGLPLLRVFQRRSVALAVEAQHDPVFPAAPRRPDDARRRGSQGTRDAVQ